MAPTPGKNLKGKQPKITFTSKVPHGSATPIRRQKKLKCSKCTNTHLPPTGAGCLSLPPPSVDPTPPPPSPAFNLSSTSIGNAVEPPIAIPQAQLSPIVSPVRSDLINRPGASSQSAPITLPIQPPQPVSNPMQDILHTNPTQSDGHGSKNCYYRK